MSKDKEPLEILVSQEETQKIKDAWLKGAEVIVVGGQPINTSYIIGIFEGQEPPIATARRIEAPKKNTQKIRQILNEMREGLRAKGIIK